VSAVVAVGAVAKPHDQAKAGLQTRAETVESQGMAAVAEAVATSGLAPSFREAHPEEFQELISLLASNNPEGYAAQCRALVAMSDDHLPQVEAPVLLVAGELDQASPPAMNRENAARMPKATLVEIAGCAHQIQWEKPDELLDAARPFLRSSS
jgi:pimeloyl-ACP methyl ester carboxylesterase